MATPPISAAGIYFSKNCRLPVCMIICLHFGACSCIMGSVARRLSALFVLCAAPLRRIYAARACAARFPVSAFVLRFPAPAFLVRFLLPVFVAHAVRLSLFNFIPGCSSDGRARGLGVPWLYLGCGKVKRRNPLQRLRLRDLL